ncbi:formyltransferase family protein [Dickeya chrysanthemi]|uniref:formyltransferase family protein n=1 Tax=Dickeya chrysanthemi TaxID=556 RepID=UPI0030181B1E
MRNVRGLDFQEVNAIHSKLCRMKNLTEKDLQDLSVAYKGLSESEIYLARHYGVPERHALAVSDRVEVADFSDLALERIHDRIRENNVFGAVIFLDAILSDTWLDFFHHRVVNAHSAVLPYARGMYAIEQLAICGKTDKMQEAAGTTLHYVDSGIDTGKIIHIERLSRLWEMESIWAVKGESYLLAFDLLKKYLDSERKFSQVDTISSPTAHESPLFLSRDFTEERKKLSEKTFLLMKEAINHA